MIQRPVFSGTPIQSEPSSDVLLFSYVSLATTLLPMVIMLLLRRYVNGVTITFITIIEPILDACFAFFFVHEHFLPLVYFGGFLALGSVLLQALASCTGRTSSSSRRTRYGWSVWFRLRKNRPVQKGVECQPSWPLGKRSCALLAQLWFEPQGEISRRSIASPVSPMALLIACLPRCTRKDMLECLTPRMGLSATHSILRGATPLFCAKNIPEMRNSRSSHTLVAQGGQLADRTAHSRTPQFFVNGLDG